MRLALSVAMGLALGCGSSEPVSLADGTRAQTEGAEEAPIGQSPARWHHFYAITEARDAVIRGDLATTRALLDRFALGDVGEDYPSDWSVFFEEIADEAGRARFVKGRVELARIVSAIGARCGECHRSHAKQGPQNIPLAVLERRVQGRTHVPVASTDHRWAAEELWLGMTIPNHQAWVAGARSLIESPLHAAPPPEPEEAPTAADDANVPTGVAVASRRSSPSDSARPVVRVLPEGELAAAEAASRRRAERLHQLVAVGETLHAKGHPLPMARAYADLIAGCASCHSDQR